MAREAGPPPVIEGHKYVELLGVGGYSDVFLYTQEWGGRDVAVKVLLDPAVTEAGRRAFVAEATAMAALSAHPSIVTIYQADVAQDGRPYLVMEYYPRPNLAIQSKKSTMPVADVLRIGVQVASAVETAHLAGMLHRDIKPANILVSAFGKPGLTDFGIAGSHDQADDEINSEGGLSVPWSPPEAFAQTTSDVRSDVYSLAATIYTLLAGRSPFAVGRTNSMANLMRRIEHDPVPPLGRGDVPVELERLLSIAMSKEMINRPESAAAFAQGLQEVESRLQLTPTVLDVPEETAALARKRADDGDGDPDATRLRAIPVIHAQGKPQASPPAPVSPPPGPVEPDRANQSMGGYAEVTNVRSDSHRAASSRGTWPKSDVPVGLPVEQTVHRAGATTGVSADSTPTQEESSAKKPGASRKLAIVGGVVAACVFGAVAVLTASTSGEPQPQPAADSPEPRKDPVGLPTPTNVSVDEHKQGVKVSWSLADQQPGDTFTVWRQDKPSVSPIKTENTSVVVETDDANPCFSVGLVRGTRPPSESGEVCLKDGQ